MTLRDRINAFEKLGDFFRNVSDHSEAIHKKDACDEKFYALFKTEISNSIHYNSWFTIENVYFAIKTWADTLTRENLENWTNRYDFSKTKVKTIGIVTAGNIPLVGFHDFITTLMAGHDIVIKQSSNDQRLLPIIADYLACIDRSFSSQIRFEEARLKDFDAVIATGSNNTARYFEYYFNKYPSIIRKSRNALAVIKGDETQDELELLGEDIFRYFGLGCRSVSKIFVPKEYNFDKIFKAIYKQHEISNYQKYKNNYDYNKAVYLMSKIPLLENGFFILKEDSSYASPIGTLFYEYYDDVKNLKERLNQDEEKIQCVVGNDSIIADVPFGQSQQPQLWDYADGVDTMQFLLGL